MLFVSKLEEVFGKYGAPKRAIIKMVVVPGAKTGHHRFFILGFPFITSSSRWYFFRAQDDKKGTCAETVLCGFPFLFTAEEAAH